MLTANRLAKAYGDQLVLKDVSFNLNANDRLGLVGPNGCGKSTLLRLLAGIDPPDAGSLLRAPGLRLGYLAQGLEIPPGTSLAQLVRERAGDPTQAEAELARTARALMQAPEDADRAAAYAHALEQLETVSRRAAPGRAETVLHRLGLGDVPLDSPAAALSGGQKTRLALALTLLGDPQLLLLDEPTNHLDLDMLAWLEAWLQDFRGGVLLVSHDRAFLDRTVTGILELDPRTHGLRAYAGNYTAYQAHKAAELDAQRQAYADQQAEILRLRQAARHLRDLGRFHKGGKSDTGDKFARGFFANRGKGSVGRAKHIEQRLEHLLTDERAEKPRMSWGLKLDFAPAATSRDVLVLEAAAVGYGQPLLTDLNLVLRAGEHVALIGPNGAGKTTLARTVAGQLPLLAGRLRLGPSVRVGYFAQEQETLRPELNALDTLRLYSSQSETALRTFLHYFLFAGDDVFIPAGDLSYGERSRLWLAVLVAQGCNFLLLDEPLNHLDLPARERFEQALATFPGAVLAIAHDRYFIERFAARVWQVAAGTIREL